MKLSQPNLHFRLATLADLDWAKTMVEDAKVRLAAAHINQWQGGYPNGESLRGDVERGYGRVVECEGRIVAYGALTYDGESAYNDLTDGHWLTPSNQPYATVHRLCVAHSDVGKGFGRAFMLLAEQEASTKVASLRVDTHPDNHTMQSLLASLDYRYCGVVRYESIRYAYEKILAKAESK